jgi:glycosyltransferase involved in cell wall biosynthesis
VSEIASLPEVVSWKINFINPWDEKSIAEKIIDFYNDKYLNISEKKFTWKENIEKTLKIYNEILWK